MSRLMLVLASAGMILVYLGLAIAGWGGFDAFFANPARTALVIATVAMAGAATFSSANLNTGEREDRSNRWVIAALGLIGLIAVWVSLRDDRAANVGVRGLEFSLGDYNLRGALLLVGIAVALLAAAILRSGIIAFVAAAVAVVAAITIYIQFGRAAVWVGGTPSTAAVFLCAAVVGFAAGLKMRRSEGS